jgi:putative membrane protein
MPGHKLLLKGKGYAAVRLSLTGCYIGIFVLLLSTPLFIWVMPFLYSYIRRGMAFILIASVLFLLLKEKNKFWAFFLFLLSGILGIATLNLPIKEPLFPLLTGLFGTSMILTSIEQKTKLPNQDFKILNLNKKEYFKISFAGLLASSLCSFLPGLGASQAAVMASDIRGKTDHKSFLVLIGIISTLVTGLNFVAIYAISKPRSGVAVIASKILEVFDLKSVIILLAVMLVSATFSLIIGLYFAKIFASCLSRLDYSKISMAILVFLIGFTVYLSGLLGFGVLIVSTAIGVTAISRGIRKMHLMGCLMLPVILYFLNIL